MSDDVLYELKVLEGKDAGKKVPLQGPQVKVGRSGGPFRAMPGTVDFEDPSVSRFHALLIWSPEGNVYQLSNRSPISPAMVNGIPAANANLAPGAKIQLGRLVAEVLAVGDVKPAAGLEVKPVLPEESVEFLGEPPPAEKGPRPAWLMRGEVPAEAPEKKSKPKKSAAAKAPAEPRQAPPPPAPPQEQTVMGFLEMVKGAEKGTRYPVYGKATSIGRSPDCDVPVSEQRVSRLHATIQFEGDRPFVVHESTSSSTKVGRVTVKTREPLAPGDEITLADRVVLRWSLG